MDTPTIMRVDISIEVLAITKDNVKKFFESELADYKPKVTVTKIYERN